MAPDLIKRSGCSALLMACLGLPPVMAQDVSITAEFKPDSANPHFNKFKNTTPASGYCAQYPQECTNNNMFSLRVPIVFESSGPIPANNAPRQGATFQVPAQWRELMVLHRETGTAHRLKVRIVGIGSRYETEDVIKLTGSTDNDYRLAHNRLWGLSWVYAPAPCGYSGFGYYYPTNYGFFWKTPEQAACIKQAKFDVPWMRYSYLDFAYELEAPDPLQMFAGDYDGSLTYTLGPGADFDFGDVMLPSSPVLALNFNLNVQHTLKVDIPPGGEKVELVPAGGWQRWLHGGRKPTRLFRDQTFNLSASSRFKMFVECSLSDGKVCFLADRDSILSVPMKVSVSLPGGLTDSAGRPVQRQELVTESGALIFQPGHYVDHQPGTLHFEVERFEHLFLPGAPTRYSGNVTVVWDSEV